MWTKWIILIDLFSYLTINREPTEGARREGVNRRINKECK